MAKWDRTNQSLEPVWSVQEIDCWIRAAGIELQKLSRYCHADDGSIEWNARNSFETRKPTNFAFSRNVRLWTRFYGLLGNWKVLQCNMFISSRKNVIRAVTFNGLTQTRSTRLVLIKIFKTGEASPSASEVTRVAANGKKLFNSHLDVSERRSRPLHHRIRLINFRVVRPLYFAMRFYLNPSELKEMASLVTIWFHLPKTDRVIGFHLVDAWMSLIKSDIIEKLMKSASDLLASHEWHKPVEQNESALSFGCNKFCSLVRSEH